MIPLSVPNISGKELEYVTECLRTGWISSAGGFVTKFETNFANRLGKKNAVSTMNGTASLHLALLGSLVKPNELVIMPNITFVATANAIKYIGAEPILIDIDPNDWQMDLELLEQFLNNDCYSNELGVLKHKTSDKKIAALMIVHVQGHMCNMDKLMKIAENWGITLIEDAAEALGATFNGQQAGTFGNFGCYSFNGNKIISTGGGGMIIAKSNDDLDHIRHLATTAKTDPMRYFHDEVGYNYRLVNILAAIGLAQLEQLNQFLEQKTRVADNYTKSLEGVGDISFQKSVRGVVPNHWLFTITTSKQMELIDYLKKKSIMARPFWIPMSNLPMYSSCEYVNSNDISGKIHKKALSIPCSTNIKYEEISFVIKAIKNFFGD